MYILNQAVDSPRSDTLAAICSEPGNWCFSDTGVVAGFAQAAINPSCSIHNNITRRGGFDCCCLCFCKRGSAFLAVTNRAHRNNTLFRQNSLAGVGISHRDSGCMYLRQENECDSAKWSTQQLHRQTSVKMHCLLYDPLEPLRLP